MFLTGGGDDDDNGLSGDHMASQEGVDCECHNRMVVLCASDDDGLVVAQDGVAAE